MPIENQGFLIVQAAPQVTLADPAEHEEWSMGKPCIPASQALTPHVPYHTISGVEMRMIIVIRMT